MVLSYLDSKMDMNRSAEPVSYEIGVEMIRSCWDVVCERGELICRESVVCTELLGRIHLISCIFSTIQGVPVEVRFSSSPSVGEV